MVGLSKQAAPSAVADNETARIAQSQSDLEKRKPKAPVAAPVPNALPRPMIVPPPVAPASEPAKGPESTAETAPEKPAA
jgi:hypothetical protein